MTSFVFFTIITNTLVKTKLQNYALISSENMMEEAFLSSSLSTNLREIEDCSQEDFKLRCELAVYSTPHPNFKRLEVKVTDRKGNVLIKEIAFKGESF